ncbi:hypothetical protein [Hungatella hathewayi]
MKEMQFLLAGGIYSVLGILPNNENREISHQYRTLWLICPEESDSLHQAAVLLGLEDIAQRFDVCIICVKAQDFLEPDNQTKDILKPLWYYIHRNLPASADAQENYIVGMEKGAVIALDLGMKYGCYYHMVGVFSAKTDSLEQWKAGLKVQKEKIQKVSLAWGTCEETCQFHLLLYEKLNQAGVEVTTNEVVYEDKWQFWRTQIIGMLPV